MSIATVQSVFPSFVGTRRAQSDLRWGFRSNEEAKDFRLKISLILPKGSKALPESVAAIGGILCVVHVHAKGGADQLY